MPNADEKLVDLRTVADKLGASEQQVYKLKQQGQIPFHMVGKRIRFYLSEIDEWVRSGEAATAINERPKIAA